MAIKGKVVQCFCPHCKKLLTTKEILLDGQETVHIIAYLENRVDIFLSAVWGKFKKVTPEVKIQKGTIISALCPHCEKELKIEFPKCSCGAPLMSVRSTDGILGNVYLCSRVGCYHHKIQPDKIPGDTPTGA